MTGIYVRVSTEEQALNGFSIRAQIDKLTSYCKIKDWEIYDIYEDNGVSGKNIKDREELKRLILDIKNKRVNNVLVYKIDRLTRSTKDLIELIDLFNENNCSFNSLTESIDTLSSTGRMFIKIIGIFAEFERENIVERVKIGLERKVKEGYTIASKNVSYGYTKEKGEKIQSINSYEAYIVKRIYNLYLENYTFTAIANYLNKYNIKTKNNKNWTYKTVKLVLTNPNYIGRVRYGINRDNYFEVEGKHNSIIDEDIFKKVEYKINYKNSNICKCGNKLRVKKQKYYSKTKKETTIYLRYYCSKCNYSYSVKRSKNTCKFTKKKMYKDLQKCK